MAADLETIGIRPDVVGMVDRPRRQPQHFFGEGGQDFETGGFDGHGIHRRMAKRPC